MSMSGGVSHAFIANLLAPYALCNLEDAEPLYVGKVQNDGRWLVLKLANTSTMTYANVSNNPSVMSYADAWTNRVGLIYGAFYALTGV